MPPDNDVAAKLRAIAGRQPVGRRTIERHPPRQWDDDQRAARAVEMRKLNASPTFTAKRVAALEASNKKRKGRA